jgi:protein O-GlcNAc transferase
LTPDDALNLAIDHHRAGRVLEAEKLYRQVLAQAPDDPDALNLLGVACHQQGRREEALRLLARAIQVNPNLATAHANLATTLREHGRMREAVDAYRRSAALAPDVALTHLGLGEALENLGQLEEAVLAYRRAAQLDPGLFDAHFDVGRALHRLERFAEAVAAFEVCVQLAPNDARGFANLGDSCVASGDLDRAIAARRRVVQLWPNDAISFGVLGSVLGNVGRLDEAIAVNRRAVQLDPRYKEAHANLGTALMRQGRIAEAIEAIRHSLELPPAVPAADSNLLLVLHYDHTMTPEALFAEHLRFAERYGKPEAGATIHVNDRSPDRPLRVGYVSPDFRDHSVTHFIEPLLTHHDRRQVEVFCYAHEYSPDEITERLRKLNLTWRQIQKLSDNQAAQLVRDDRVDILVDLAGHTAHNRLLVLTRRPAPVQVTYLGYPDTTGLCEVDYRLTDAFADPPGRADALHAERLVRLPRTAWCFQPQPDAPPVNELPARSSGWVTFASFNAAMKISPPTIELWAALVKRVPNARLLIKAVAFLDDSTMYRLGEQFAAQGLNREQIILNRPHLEKAEHYAMYQAVDIALDPPTYNGTTTTCEALWMGVPVVTIAGDRHATRVGVSLLNSVGLPELVASSPEEFLDVAASLAGDLDRLAALRQGLRERMRNSPLMDAAGFARDVEHAYRAMWKRWCCT